MPDHTFDFDALRRAPDVEAPNLFAVDPTDRLLLDEAAPFLAEASAGSVVVANDRYGALTLGAIALHGASDVRVHQDAYSGERALERNASAQDIPSSSFRSMDAAPGLFAGARVVLLQLPRQLEALDELAALVAGEAHPEVVVFAGGRLKHMTPAMNEVLARHFGEVRASRARQKSRLLVARGPLAQSQSQSQSQSEAKAQPQSQTQSPSHPHPQSQAQAQPQSPSQAQPQSPSQAESPSRAHSPVQRPSSSRPDSVLPARHDAALDLWVAAAGAAFGGTRVDIGTRFLLEFLPEVAADARLAIDLGCGTGILATVLARARPDMRVIATDQSAAAVRSARETARLNGVAERVDVVRDDALTAQPDASADVILLNPPFHVGSTVHTGIALKLFAEASRVLRPGGELFAVWNTHLAYRPALERLVGPTEQRGRNAKFTVTVSRRR